MPNVIMSHQSKCCFIAYLHNNTFNYLHSNYFYFLKFFFFLCGPFLKSLMSLLQILLLFYALVFWLRGMQVHQPGIEPTPTALGNEVLNTGLPWKSPDYF